jgi:hypothetical protein
MLFGTEPPHKASRSAGSYIATVNNRATLSRFRCLACCWLRLPATPSSVNLLDSFSCRYYAFTVYRISVSVKNRKNVKP